MAKATRPIPEGHHTVTPYLCVRNAEKAIEFYKKAFGAEEVMRMPGPNGKGVAHAELKIGDSFIYLSDEFPDGTVKSPESLGGTTCNIHIYTEDTDRTFERAVIAGAKAEMPPADMFWGDRYAKLTDPFGHAWGIATAKETLTEQEMSTRAQEFYASLPK